MLTKEKVISAIQAMPEDKFENVDVLLNRIVEMEQIETGIQQIKDGQTISHQETKNIINTWFTK
jgi:hypothetical protein